MSSERILINLDAVLNDKGFRDARRELLEVNGLEERLIKNNTTLSKPAKLGITNSIKEAKKEAEGLSGVLSEAFAGLADGLKGGLGDALGGLNLGGLSLGVAGVGAAAAAGLAVAGAAVLELTKEYDALRKSIKLYTGASGDDLANLVVQTQAISQTFGESTDEIQLAANALSKNLGISFGDALTEIERGLAAGANKNGEFLSNLKEYPSALQAAGLSAQQLTDILIAQSTEGVFSDKAVDAVKEFNLRIKEQTPATRDALVGAFGAAFTDDLLKKVDAGKVTTVQALDIIAAKSKDSSIPITKLQTVITDVFGGAGEDAGLGFIQSLEGISTGAFNANRAISEYEKTQLSLLAANKDLAAAQERLTANFTGVGDKITILTTRLRAFLYDVLAGVGEAIEPILSALRRLGATIANLFDGIKDFDVLQAIIDGISFSFEVLGKVIGFAIDAVGFLIDKAKNIPVIKDAIDTVVFGVNTFIDAISKIPAIWDGIVAFVTQSAQNIADTFRFIYLEAQLFIKELDQAFRIRPEKRLELQREIDALNREIAGLGNGKTAADAFVEAYNKRLKDKGKDIKDTTTKAIQGDKALNIKANVSPTIKTDPTKAKAEAEKLAAENKKRDRELEKLRINGIEDETKRKIELVRFGLRTELEDYEGNAKQKAEFRKLKEAEATKAILQIQKEAYDRELKARKDLTDDVIDYEREPRRTALELEIDTLKDIADPTPAQKKLLLQKERDLALLSNKERLDAELIQAEEYARKKAELTGEPLDIIGAQAPIETASQTREANIKAKFGLDIQEVDFEAARAEIESLEARLDSSVSESEIRQAGLLTSLEEQYTRGIISYADYEAQKTDILRDAELQRLQIQKDGLTKQLDAVNTLLASDTITESQRTELVKQQTDLRLELADVALKAGEAANQVLKDTADKSIAKIEQQVNTATGLANSAIQIVQAVADFTKDKDAEVVDSQIENTKRRIDELLALESEANLQQVENEKIRLNQLVAAKEEAARKEQRIANIIAAAQYAVAVAEGSLAIAKQAQLPFPYNLVAIIGTVAALAAGGISLVSKFQATQQSAATGFYDGGYTGDKGEREVAGVVHGREFVVTAKKTKEFRPLLDAINTGKIKPSDLTTFAPNYNAATIVREQAATKIKDDDIIKEIRTTNKILSQSVQKSARDAVRENMKSKRV